MKKISKKIAPLVLAAMMSLNCLPVFAYSDIDYNDSSWYNGVINEATQNGWMSGYEDGRFAPNDTMSRAMAATVLYRMAKGSIVGFSVYYPDVQDPNVYYAAAVTWAKENQVITGYENGYFGPNDALTREQLAVILYRYAASLGCDVSQRASIDSFSDASKVSGFATAAMQWCVSIGVLNGDAGRLKPTAPVTRAEACKMLVVSHKYISQNQGQTDESLSQDASGIVTASQLKGLSIYQVIELMAPVFQADAASSGVLASVSMAQFILESGYGQSTLAQEANNLFGMKTFISGNTWAGSKWDGVSSYTKVIEELDASGNSVVQTAYFRKYASVADSIADHSAYLVGAMNGNSLRYAGLKGCTDYKAAFEIIAAGGYAGNSSTYTSSLCSIVEKYNLTQYD